MVNMTCYWCDKEFEYHEEDICVTNDIVGGQYIEFEVVSCPFCELTVKL